jgi:hypothetical protein
VNNGMPACDDKPQFDGDFTAMMKMTHVLLACCALLSSSAVASAECRVPTGWTSIYPGVDGDIKQLGIKGALKKFLGVEKFDRPLESYSPDEFQEAYTQMGVRAGECPDRC